TIAFNNGLGIALTGAANGVTIRVNSIHSNAGLGIDLGGDGVTMNDPLDADTGPNGLQNFPVITSVAAQLITGTFNGAPNTAFTLDLYSSPAADASGFGEGEVWQGS